jgi:hypothetical protein
MRRLGWTGLAVILSAAFLVLAVAVPLGSPWRPAAALIFASVGPGASLVPLLGLRDRAMEFVLVIPVSFAVVILVAAALFYPGLWSPDRQLVVLLALCAAGLAGRLIGTRGRAAWSGRAKLAVPRRAVLEEQETGAGHTRDAAT